jgi:deoxyribonuclease V
VLACVDVDYRPDGAVAACLLFAAWDAAAPSASYALTIESVAAYEPGAFYRRELPCVRAVLDRVDVDLDVVVIDGYVWLGPVGSDPGLGAHLHRVLGGSCTVVGVAKNPFRGGSGAVEILRGTSAKPLYVTAEGMPYQEAAARVAAMHGEHRVPTLLRQVDQLARTWVQP